MLQLVVWDWNGTLIADTQACMDAGNHVIRTYGGTPLPRKTYAATFDFPTIDFYCRQGCDRESLESGYREAFYGFYAKRASRCRTRQGARKALAWLRERSIPSVILSNHLEGDISSHLDRLSLTEYFGRILANTEIGVSASGNNKIYMMRKHLTDTSYNPSETVIVGDSPEDIAIGRELHMRTVAVEDGYFSTPRLRASKPDHIIGSLRKSTEIFEECHEN
ncbi:MAG: HAD family hydrolase [Candidatus Aenigmarchaeota archaeon]|nr:HAD family hydrolase [Candidatus Aenigmarchaeota archaeon]